MEKDEQNTYCNYRFIFIDLPQWFYLRATRSFKIIILNFASLMNRIDMKDVI